MVDYADRLKIIFLSVCVYGVKTITECVGEHLMHHNRITTFICTGLCVTYPRNRWVMYPNFNKT